MERVLDFIVRGNLDDVGLKEGQNTDRANQNLVACPDELSVPLVSDDHTDVADDLLNKADSNKEIGSKKSLDHLFSRSGQLARKSPVDVDQDESQVDEASTASEIFHPNTLSASKDSRTHIESADRASDAKQVQSPFLHFETEPSESSLSKGNLPARSSEPLGRVIAEPPDAPSSLTSGVEKDSFDIFKVRFGQLIKNRSLKLCEVIFDNTLAQGKSEYFTTTTQLTKIVGVHQRQCYNILSKLESLGFINRSPVEENGRLIGIILSINLNPFT